MGGEVRGVVIQQGGVDPLLRRGAGDTILHPVRDGASTTSQIS